MNTKGFVPPPLKRVGRGVCFLNILLAYIYLQNRLKMSYVFTFLASLFSIICNLKKLSYLSFGLETNGGLVKSPSGDLISASSNSKSNADIETGR